jgi:hypothetical protein
MEIFQKLETNLAEKSWTDKFSEDDVKFFGDVKDMSQNLINQIYVFIDYFHQYVDVIQSSAVFSPEFNEQKREDGKVYPTQTSSDPAPEEVVVP